MKSKYTAFAQGNLIQFLQIEKASMEENMKRYLEGCRETLL